MVEIRSLVPLAAAPLTDEQLAAHYSAGVADSWLRVNFVSSVDGAATVDGRSGGLGDDADHRVFDLLRTLCDAVLVAAGTVRIEGYSGMRVSDADAEARVARGLAPQPTMVVVSRSLDLDPASELFTKAPVRPIVFTVAGAKPSAALTDVADVVACGDASVDPVAMRAELVARGLPLIHCEGGPSFFASLLEADVVDELCLTVSPKLVGGSSRRIVHGTLPTPRPLSLAGLLRSENTLLARYLRA